MNRVVRQAKIKNIDLLLDIGANRGQFSQEIIRHGYSGDIISFEPLPDAWTELNATAKRAGRKWTVAERMALGKDDYTTELTVAGNSASSSILNQSASMLELAPFTAPVDKIPVQVRRLDRVIHQNHHKGSSIAIKIDTQGFELQVLLGAQGLLDQVTLIILEMSIGCLYKEQPPYFEVDRHLRDIGFQLCDFEPGFRSPVSYSVLEYDAIYHRVQPMHSHRPCP